MTNNDNLLKLLEDEIGEFLVHHDEPVYTTGVVSKLLDIPLWVLKQLDKEGVVSPPRESSFKSRLYSKRELDKLHMVWRIMNKRKIKVNAIKIILELHDQT